MPALAETTFEVKSWDEQPYDEMEGVPKLTRARVTHDYHGGIEGQSTVEYLMVYPSEDAATFVGLERVTGRIGDRSGSFVLQHTGTFAGGIAKVEYFVVPGSATGDLSGLRGQGGFATGHVQPHPFELDYDFE